MRAFGFREHGGPDVLDFFELDAPEPGRGEVLVSVEAVALNHLDLWVRQGWPGLEIELPHVMGTDCAGIVTELGEGVTSIDVDTPVVVNPSMWCDRCRACRAGEQSLCRSFALMGEHRQGALTEHIVVPARNVVPRPADMGVPEAAASPLVFQTAWRMARRGRVRPGHIVLVPGAGGGVASAAIQIAALIGARVIATTSDKRKADKARELGAEEVFLYTDDDWGKQVYTWTKKRGVDVVMDSAGAKVWPDAQRFLRKGGRFVTCGATSGPTATVDLRYVFSRQLELVGSTMANAREFEQSMKLVFDGRLRPIVDRTFPFDKALKAVERLEKGEQFGKVVIEL